MGMGPISRDSIWEGTSQPTALALYIPVAKLNISTDASCYGLGGVLLQQHSATQWRPVPLIPWNRGIHKSKRGTGDCVGMIFSLVPRLSPAFFVQYATKSWGGAWEQGYMIFTNWKRGTGDCVGMWEVQWLGCGEVNLAKDRPQTSSPPPQHNTPWPHATSGITFQITASNRFLRYSSIPYSGKFSYGGNFRIIRMPCEHTKI